MKQKIEIFILSLVVIGLGSLLGLLEYRSAQEQRLSGDQLVVLSNTVSSVISRLDEVNAVNVVLQSNLVAHKASYSNELSVTQAKCDEAAAELAKVQADTKNQALATAAELARLDKEVAELETHHEDLDAQTNGLHSAILNLADRIQETKDKLVRSTGDREFLLYELKELQAKKSALEKDFNDLAVVIKRMHAIKAEVAAARIHDWVRRGVYKSLNQKGGQRLVHPVVVLPPDTNAIWHVDLYPNGGVAITAPVSTNTPPSQ